MSTNSVEIYAFAEDVSKPPFTSLIPPTRANYGRYRVVISDGTPRHALTSAIKHAKKTDEKIGKLHLISHGAPGLLFLSGGKHAQLALDADACSWFGALRAHFDTIFPEIFIHGCNVASDITYNPGTGIGNYDMSQSGIGYRFLLAMAQATNTIVTGCIHRQFNDTFHLLEGPRITVGPKGAVSGAEYLNAPYPTG
ncbi:MAG: hypothetical protein H6970_11985 [Gammaproteobacteria bacterium]|nr:hypothetical protein [Gammaproteobacteria bacterium]MCP5425766.1 hypothetical protein [Gammaproteobacteria bacterium]MCP5458623.1 hypothetical protein [Gammaproteobacteria bacterium]